MGKQPLLTGAGRSGDSSQVDGLDEVLLAQADGDSRDVPENGARPREDIC